MPGSVASTGSVRSPTWWRTSSGTRGGRLRHDGGGGGMTKSRTSITRRKAPETHDYPAALSYLKLHFEPRVAKQFVKKLRRAAVSEFKAKDIFRSSSLSLLGVSNSHIEMDRQKI